MAGNQTSAVLEVAGVHWASEKATVERVLGRRPGVLEVEANPVGQTATVTYDPARTSVADLTAWIRDCGYHCAGQSVPRHVCDPAAEPHARDDHSGRRPPADAGETDHGPAVHAGHDTGHGALGGMTPQEAMGHGGHHAGLSVGRSEEHTSELQSRQYLVCRLLLEKK